MILENIFVYVSSSHVIWHKPHTQITYINYNMIWCVNIHIKITTLLSNAYVNKNVMIIKHLLRISVDIEPRIYVEKNLVSTLVWACTNKCLSVIKLIFAFSKKNGYNINLNISNNLAFYNACQRGDVEIVKYLWELSLKTNQKIYIHSKLYTTIKSPFEGACCSNNIDTITYLHNLLVNGDENYDNFNYAFSEACFFGNLNTVKYLYNLLQLENDNLEEAFFSACAIRNIKICKYLLSLSSDTNKLKWYNGCKSLLTKEQHMKLFGN